MIHFSSDEDFDILDIFNNDLDREFVTNKDYVRVGGSNSLSADDDSSSQEDIKEDSYDQAEDTKKLKKKRKQYKIKWNQEHKTSKIGSIKDQMEAIPQKYKQTT